MQGAMQMLSWSFAAYFGKLAESAGMVIRCRRERDFGIEKVGKHFEHQIVELYCIIPIIRYLCFLSCFFVISLGRGYSQGREWGRGNFSYGVNPRLYGFGEVFRLSESLAIQK